MGTCPDCEENFEIDEEAEIGNIVECPKCGARLEILNTFPVTIDYAPEVEE
jgi:alpha-aminoadipate carrier protein LysW